MYTAVRCDVGYFFFFIHTSTTVIYTLSLHDALPISESKAFLDKQKTIGSAEGSWWAEALVNQCSNALHELTNLTGWIDRKSTRLNSSHSQISYAVFCLKKKKL